MNINREHSVAFRCRVDFWLGMVYDTQELHGRVISESALAICLHHKYEYMAAERQN